MPQPKAQNFKLTYLRQLAISFGHVLERCGFHKEGILTVALSHALSTFVIARGEYARSSALHRGPHALVSWKVWVLKEFHRRAALHSAVFDFVLLGEIVSAVDGRVHSLHGEESGEVGCVGCEHDEGEKPPHSCSDKTNVDRNSISRFASKLRKSRHAYLWLYASISLWKRMWAGKKRQLIAS